MAIRLLFGDVFRLLLWTLFVCFDVDFHIVSRFQFDSSTFGVFQFIVDPDFLIERFGRWDIDLSLVFFVWSNCLDYFLDLSGLGCPCPFYGTPPGFVLLR